jgi:hypothetical protein
MRGLVARAVRQQASAADIYHVPYLQRLQRGERKTVDGQWPTAAEGRYCISTTIDLA